MSELCHTGKNLWIETRNCFTMDKYKRYINHVRRCGVCQKGLKLSEFDLELLNKIMD